ncbi:hypothetical protein DSECCO2_619090 [anaerobic digester metagenome]
MDRPMVAHQNSNWMENSASRALSGRMAGKAKYQKNSWMSSGVLRKNSMTQVAVARNGRNSESRARPSMVPSSSARAELISEMRTVLARPFRISAPMTTP